MTIPLQFASLYHGSRPRGMSHRDGQEVFVWYDFLLHLGADFVVADMAFLRDA